MNAVKLKANLPFRLTFVAYKSKVYVFPQSMYDFRKNNCDRYSFRFYIIVKSVHCCIYVSVGITIWKKRN